MNDPNEADLHERIQAALGRTPGNPLLVVSQKTVTGHAKGGAAAWQVEGVLQMMERGVVPGNRNLECADPLLRDGAFLTLGDRPIRLARAGADPRGARHEPRLRPRLGAARDRASGQVPRRRPGGAARGLPAPRRPSPRRGRAASGCARGSAGPRPCAAATAGSAPPATRRRARSGGRAADRPRDAPRRRRHVRAGAVTTLAVGLDIVTTTTFAAAARRPGVRLRRRDVHRARAARRARRRRGARAAPRRALRRQGGVRQGVVGRACGREPALARSTCARSRSSTTATAARRCACTARSRRRSAARGELGAGALRPHSPWPRPAPTAWRSPRGCITSSAAVGSSSLHASGPPAAWRRRSEGRVSAHARAARAALQQPAPGSRARRSRSERSHERALASRRLGAPARLAYASRSSLRGLSLTSPGSVTPGDAARC